jgi:hypothetical protein
MKSFSFSRIDAGLVFKVTINDLITYGSCFASIGSKLIELIYETFSRISEAWAYGWDDNRIDGWVEG